MFSILLLPLVYATRAEDCKCLCSGYSSKTVCDKLEDLRLEVDANTGELKKWAQLFPFVQNLRSKLRDDVVHIVRTEIELYLKEKRTLPVAENLVRKADEKMMNDSGGISKPKEDEMFLAKNVSTLLAKVEMVENRTIEVEQELKSERRVRRHLEEEVKETQSSLISLGDQLQNATPPVDTIINEVQKVLLMSLEDMNRTIHEEHLKKLYYKIDGVVYQNETKKLDERLEHVETELHEEGNSSVVSKLAEELKNLEEDVTYINNSIGDDLVPRLNILESETVRKDAAEHLEMKMSDLLNNTEVFRMELAGVWSNIHDFKSLQDKLEDFSEQWSTSLEALQKQINELKKRTNADLTEPLAGLQETFEKNDVNEDNETDAFKDTNDIDKFSDIVQMNETSDDNTLGNPTENVTESKYEDPMTGENETQTGIGNNDTLSCDSPISDDLHLLIDIADDSKGGKNLVFGCQPIGRYAASRSPVPVRCEEGLWKGPFPKCNLLLDEMAVHSLAEELKQENPCEGGFGEFPDPMDCSKFFKCSFGKVTLMKCPNGLHFNPLLKLCDYRKVAGCSTITNKHTKELYDLVPPILVEPSNLDKPSSLLGTGISGELIVHPRSTFTLHCLYPENFWGSPTWNVTYRYSEISDGFSIEEGKNRVSIAVTAAIEEDSGIYKCVTPFGKEHAIRVKVKAVLCPPFTISDEFEDVYYRPTPEGEHRILGTTAEFLCEDDRRIVSVCMANGNWSRGPPTDQECLLKRRKEVDEWKCPPLDISKRPLLMVERIESERIVVFRCAGRLRLIGNSFTRCRDDGYWSHIALPRCVS